MEKKQVEKLEDGRYFAFIPGFKGPWADGDTEEECLRELRSAFEEWLAIALREDDELPEIMGMSLNFGGRRWQKPLASIFYPIGTLKRP